MIIHAGLMSSRHHCVHCVDQHFNSSERAALVLDSDVIWGYKAIQDPHQEA